jgi:hypothetical protein
MAMASSGGGSVASTPNVTPMIDVMLVLLIIFMVVTPALLAGFNADPPQAVNIKDHPEDEKNDQVLGLERLDERERLTAGQITSRVAFAVGRRHQLRVCGPIVRGVCRACVAFARRVVDLGAERVEGMENVFDAFHIVGRERQAVFDGELRLNLFQVPLVNGVRRV